jgi:hypothetical protein
MAITETEVVELATVEVGDDYRVHLRQYRKAMDYTPEQALQLSCELAQAALEARRLLADGLSAMSDRVRSAPASEVV